MFKSGRIQKIEFCSLHKQTKVFAVLCSLPDGEIHDDCPESKRSKRLTMSNSTENHRNHLHSFIVKTK